MKNLAAGVALLLMALSCQEKPQSDDGLSKKVDSLFVAYGEFKARINPIEATKGGDYRYNDYLANYISGTYQEELRVSYGQFLESIQSIELNKIDPSRSLSLRVMKWDCEIKLEGLTNDIVTIASPMYDLPNFELMPITQITSLQLYMGQLAAGYSVQPFNTPEDYDNWLSRVEDYLAFIDTAITNMKEGIDQGIVLPRVLIPRVISQFEDLTSGPAKDHLFYSPVKLIPEDFSDSDRLRIAGEYETMISKRLVPKYLELIEFMETVYLPSGRSTSGIGALPNGKASYDYLIKLHTTTNMTADEIFELGQREVARIEKEMKMVKDELDFTGDLKAFLDHIRSREDQMPFTKPEEVIANFNSIHDRMSGSISQVFRLQPKAQFEVRRTEAFREASASAEYVPGSKDGTRPGIFYVPIRDVDKYNKFQDEALFLHEAIPGHHFQLSLQQENQNLPVFLHPESMGVFVEGWALYAESLGKELGLYTDPYQYFGMLSMEMHRAIRLVVDAGIHAKGWTREQAIAYSLEHEAESEASITSEIERYMATPGQALSYKLGQLKIRELRNKAEKQLKEKFDLRAYHDQVLNSGSLPLVLLEEKINNWIESELK